MGILATQRDILRPFLGTNNKGISNKKVLTGGTFKIKVGFEAKINIETKTKVKAKVEAKVKIKINKFSTVIRGTNSNIENFDINNLIAGLIVLISLIILPDLIILINLIFIEKVIIKIIKILLGCKVVVTAIRFSYFL